LWGSLFTIQINKTELAVAVVIEFRDALIAGTIVVLLTAGVMYLVFGRWEQYSSADWGGRFKNRLAGLLCRFVYFYHRLRFSPIPLPEKGGAVVVSNHVSGLDPLLLIAASRRPLRFVIAQEQYQRFGLQWLFRLAGCIPVDRSRRPEWAMRAALRALNDGEVVALFPHGKIHLDSDPPIKIKGGAVRLSQLSGCPVYPVRLEGVHGEGHTVLAVFIRSKARLIPEPPMVCQPHHYAENLHKVQELIETPAPASLGRDIQEKDDIA
jgi:1-acyl-sn-glycerol-3-phosphate acyltransferase